jgi:hypothetical protein
MLQYRVGCYGGAALSNLSAAPFQLIVSACLRILFEGVTSLVVAHRDPYNRQFYGPNLAMKRSLPPTLVKSPPPKSTS